MEFQEQDLEMIVYIDDMMNNIYNCDYLINYGIDDGNREYNYRKSYNSIFK